MIFGTVCSGLGTPELAWAKLGWRCAFMSEIEAFPRALLKHHWPEVKCHGDFTTIKAGEYERIDLLAGGTPCQDFSIAGLRAGMAGDRGNLTLEFLRLVDRLRPRWVVWENVPGVLSSNGGRDFGSFLGGLGFLGYGFAYRVLDAQFFGVPQRRNRVFVVGYLGDWRRAAAVLFERESLHGNPPPRRSQGEGTAPTLAGGARERGGWSTDDIPAVSAALTGGTGAAAGRDLETAGNLITSGLNEGETAKALATGGNATNGRYDISVDTFVAHTLRGEGHDASCDGSGKGTPLVVVPDVSPTLRSGSTSPASHGKQNGTDREALVVTTLAIRGREGGHNLEWREDGQANAILTPNGGRAGIGVGAVAFDTAQITSPANRTRVAPGEPASTMPARGSMHVAFNPQGAGDQTRLGFDPDADTTGALAAGPRMGVVSFGSKGAGLDVGDVSPTLRAGNAPNSHDNGGTPPAVAFTISEPSTGYAWEKDTSHALQARQPGTNSNTQYGVRSGMVVRRLMPIECERLQGLPDNHTLIPYRKGMSADGPRYKAIGNGMALPVVVWIGERIALVDAL